MPTPQEVQEHNLTHLPYRNWCPICVRGKGRTTNHPPQRSKQPVVQVDLAYIKAHNEKPTPVLTAVNVQTGLCMAAMIPDKQQLFDYATTCLQTFLLECGRTEAILQSDQEDYLMELLKATASSMGNISVRFSPAYSSQSQGAVERLHRTLFGQFRVRQPATLHQRANNKKSHHGLDDETLCIPHHQLPTTQWRTNKLLPQMATQQHSANLWIWRNSSVHGSKVLQRNLAGKRHNNQWILHQNSRRGCSSTNNQTTSRATQVQQRVTRHDQWNAVVTNTTNIHTNIPETQRRTYAARNSGESSHSKARSNRRAHGSQGSRRWRKHQTSTYNRNNDRGPLGHDNSNCDSRKQHSQMSAGWRHHTWQWSKTTKEDRTTDSSTTAGARSDTANKQNENQRSYCHLEQRQASHNSNKWGPARGPERTATAGAHNLQHGRVWSNKGQTRNDEGDEFNETTGSARSSTHQRNNTRGESQHHRVKVGASRQGRGSLMPNCCKGLQRERQRRGRHLRTNTIVCDSPNNPSDILIAKGWRLKIGDISAAFLHAAVQGNILMRPPKEFYTDPNILWRLKKAMYGLRSSPRAWQDHLATVDRFRTQRVPTSTQQSIHHGLCWRPPVRSRGARNQQDLWADSATHASPTNRRINTRKHGFLPRKANHKQRQLLRNHIRRQLHRQHPTRSTVRNMQSCDNTGNNNKGDRWKWGVSTWNNTNSTGEWLESYNGSPTHGQTWPTQQKS